jgi:hypothetical protein
MLIDAIAHPMPDGATESTLLGPEILVVGRNDIVLAPAANALGPPADEIAACGSASSRTVRSCLPRPCRSCELHATVPGTGVEAAVSFVGCSLHRGCHRCPNHVSFV